MALLLLLERSPESADTVLVRDGNVTHQYQLPSSSLSQQERELEVARLIFAEHPAARVELWTPFLGIQEDAAMSWVDAFDDPKTVAAAWEEQGFFCVMEMDLV